jgi:plastocyanin
MALAARTLPWLAVPMVALPMVLVHPDEAPARSDHGAVTMGHEVFSRGQVTLHVGQTLELDNTSSWLHVIVPGEDAVTVHQAGLPDLGRHGAHVSQTGDAWTVGPFDRVGQYRMTCSLHPEMNLTVDVLA